LVRQNKEQRLATLEQSLLAVAKGRSIEILLEEIRKKGLVTVLRKRAAGVKTPRSQSAAKRAP
jgi:hypothetical protein